VSYRRIFLAEMAARVALKPLPRLGQDDRLFRRARPPFLFPFRLRDALFGHGGSHVVDQTPPHQRFGEDVEMARAWCQEITFSVACRKPAIFTC